MKMADIKVSWVPSVSPDVTSVEFVMVTNGGGGGPNVEIERVTLNPNISEVQLNGLAENTSYIVTVTVTDGTNFASANLDINIPDLSAPLPVTNLAFEILTTYQVPNT